MWFIFNIRFKIFLRASVPFVTQRILDFDAHSYLKIFLIAPMQYSALNVVYKNFFLPCPCNV